ncbi:MAG: hypothetical protein Hyperionvirus1_142 [Hyperionvirus sp.]|uniref:Uncharacterized protein n=1 Tax=Hyperionvirus sp. TaxID=2487770 RepID=A0A3G5A9Q8_9VIRU|nr:MAG: hypothetical protein Hyperionvirus1_142 [Hyperionvirus sp.]
MCAFHKYYISIFHDQKDELIFDDSFKLQMLYMAIGAVVMNK